MINTYSTLLERSFQLSVLERSFSAQRSSRVDTDMCFPVVAFVDARDGQIARLAVCRSIQENLQI